MHAFIIEDEYLIGQSLRDMLEKLGFTSFSFDRSEDAAVMVQPRRTSTLLPPMSGDGVRAVEAICQKRAIPVVFITGYAEDVQDRAPHATVVQKPVKEHELAAAVRNVLRQKRDDPE